MSDFWTGVMVYSVIGGGILILGWACAVMIREMFDQLNGR